MSDISRIPNASALFPLRGSAYVPAPSDDALNPPEKYFDTDFTNSTFPLIWGKANGGRGDLSNFANDLRVNFLHLYDWSTPPYPGQEPGQNQRSHISFLNECAANNIKVFVPISNYFLVQLNKGKDVTAFITAMVIEIYNAGTTPHKAAGIWGIGNEFDQPGEFTVTDVAKMIQILINIETKLGIPTSNLLPITSPVSFADPTHTNIPGIIAIQKLQAALKNIGLENVWNNRFIASINPQNSGDYIRNYIDVTFPKYFPNIPFFFTEMGAPIKQDWDWPVKTEEQQADYVLSQIQNSHPRGNFLGACVFQFLNQTTLKTGSESTFGMTKHSGSFTTGIIPQSYKPGGGQTYNVDTLTHKPMYQSVKTGFSAM
ncbi:hypothetical protein CLU81_0196 [Flavobacterium sp. 9]|uniref:hypothetical protein n=1 Tax=Flavobacterium sp. 9 TaxID=2035198 RepID=UPI000C1908C5|nr:hypothetical protein [Flavobacterium sp. 9]PIF29812.1 hypothetical protein CLU81_0196 [Flavobacterium sp. 9]